MQRKERVRWILVSSIVFILTFTMTQSERPVVSGNEISVSHLAAIPHDPIIINGDANFTDTASAEGWQGDGSSGNPFVIDNLDIDRGGNIGACINISNTRVNFTIQNCNLTGANTHAGIYLSNVSHGFLSNNTCNLNRYGIYLLYSSHNTLESNTCYANSDRGIYMYDSDFNTVVGNDCDDNTNYGIFLYYCDSSLLSSNLCSSTGATGIHVRSSISNSFENNICNQNGDGIRVWEYSSGNMLLRNTCDFNTNYGILIHNDDYARPAYITDNHCSNNDYGILSSGTFLNVVNNTLMDNLAYGIEAECSDSTITRNFVKGSDQGIRLFHGSYNLLSHNEITKSYSYGVWLEESQENMISQNSITENTIMGIVVAYSSVMNTIFLNDISVDLDAFYDEFTGIYLDSSAQENNVTLNYLLHLGPHPDFAAIYDNYAGSWGNIIDRNWYEDYGGHDDNGDGFGEDPYDIPGSAANSDLRPLVYLPHAPSWVESPLDQVVDYWSQPFYYDMNATAASPMTWAVNDTSRFVIDSNGILQSIVDLPVAVYGLAVRVTNIYGIYITSSFYLTVQEISLPEWIVGPEDLMLSSGEGFDYGLIVTDESGITEWAINDTINFSLSVTWLNVTGYKNGWHLLHIANATVLMAGMYGLNVTATDPYGNSLSGVFLVTILPPEQDITPPTWIVAPVNQILEYGKAFIQRLGAWDSSGIEYWWVNDTVNFAIDENGVIRNATILAPGVYRLEVRTFDPFENYCSATLILTVLEATTTPSSTTSTTTTTTTPTTTPSPTPDIFDPIVMFLFGVGLGGGIVLVVIIMLYRKRL